jgi:hypothetical protein
MKGKVGVLVVAVLSTVLWTLPVWPNATSSAAVTVHVVIQRYLAVSLNNSVGAQVIDTHEFSLERVDPKDGYVESLDAVSLEVRGNMPWTLEISAAQGNSEDVATETSEALLSRLLVRVSGEDYVPFTSSGLLLAVGERGVHELRIDYRFLIEPGMFDDSRSKIEVVYRVQPMT